MGASCSPRSWSKRKENRHATKSWRPQLAGKSTAYAQFLLSVCSLLGSLVLFAECTHTRVPNIVFPAIWAQAFDMFWVGVSGSWLTYYLCNCRLSFSSSNLSRCILVFCRCTWHTDTHRQIHTHIAGWSHAAGVQLPLWRSGNAGPPHQRSQASETEYSSQHVLANRHAFIGSYLKKHEENNACWNTCCLQRRAVLRNVGWKLPPHDTRAFHYK